ncbi:hypothetical protein BH20ACT1_BH20ACT1_08480 [soil metagenome]
MAAPSSLPQVEVAQNVAIRYDEDCDPAKYQASELGFRM